MSRFIAPTLLLAVAFTPACDSDRLPTTSTGTTAATKTVAAKEALGDNNQLTVYTQNVYVGTDVDAVLSSPPEELQGRLFTALATFQDTNWPERAAAIAGFIAEKRPDIVALNEVSTVTVLGLSPAFPDTHVDFLSILQSALRASNLDYLVAGKVANIDANLSLGGPSIRLQDYDVVLVRRAITISNVVTHNYAAHVVVPLAFGSVDLIRGWVSVDATEGDRTVRFVASHLEPQETSLPLQLAQSGELIATLAGSPHPVIIASDLNTDPLDPAPLTSYDQFISAGFQDAWVQRAGQPHATGLTCCENPTLLNPVPSLTKRIDLVLVRPDGKAKKNSLHPVDIEIFGDQPGERTVNGLWPSDHAGVLAKMQWKKVDK